MMMQPMISLSHITLSPSPPSLGSFSLCTLSNYQIGHCQQEHQNTTFGRNYQTRCGKGITNSTDSWDPMDYVNHKMHMAKTSFNYSEPTAVGTNKRKRDPDSDSKETEKKRQKLEGFEMSIKFEKEQLETEPSDNLAVNSTFDIQGVISSSSNDDKVEKAKKMAQKAAVLLFYGEMLQNMGEKLRAQSRALLDTIF